LADNAVESDFDEFWDELLREAEVTGDPQHAVFFRMYAESAAENGDCADLVYTPVRREGKGGYQVDGYAYDPDRGELHIAACDFRPEREIQRINADSVVQTFKRVARFCKAATDPDFVHSLEESSPAFEIAWVIHKNQQNIRRIRCVLFTNTRLAIRKKALEAPDVLGAHVSLNILDYLRYRDIQLAQGGVEPIELNIREMNNALLPCLDAHLEGSDYESYLVVMPGNLLARIYGIYGARLMEQNVRTFLQARTKANKGIIETATQQPEMFFAYNNGLTATASDVVVEEAEDGTCGIAEIKDLQIVNGGQTTASLLYAQDKSNADLSHVFVQMKLSVVSPDRIEEAVPLISRYANTQNRISEADFFSSHPFHVEMQQISRRLAAPIAEGSLSATRWFYERARGQYRNELALRSPADRRKFEKEYPKSQVIQKTDVAKYQLTFEAKPHVVSLGAQKCFLQYAQEISKVWDKSKNHFDDGYFRNLVSKAILFRWLDSEVGRSEWYKSDRGYKANIITYTLAWLVHYLELKFQCKLNFNLIWKLQGVPEELKFCLDDLAPRVSRILRAPPAGVTNISEYAKTQGCWATVAAAELPVDKSITRATIILKDSAQNEKDAKATRKMDNEIRFDELLEENMHRMPALQEVAGRRGLLSPKSSKALAKISQGNINLSKPERNALRFLFDKLEESGHGPSSWSSD